MQAATAHELVSWIGFIVRISYTEYSDKPRIRSRGSATREDP